MQGKLVRQEPWPRQFVRHAATTKPERAVSCTDARIGQTSSGKASKDSETPGTRRRFEYGAVAAFLPSGRTLNSYSSTDTPPPPLPSPSLPILPHLCACICLEARGPACCATAAPRSFDKDLLAVGTLDDPCTEGDHSQQCVLPIGEPVLDCARSKVDVGRHPKINGVRQTMANLKLQPRCSGWQVRQRHCLLPRRI